MTAQSITNIPRRTVEMSPAQQARNIVRGLLVLELINAQLDIIEEQLDNGDITDSNISVDSAI